MSQEQFHQTVQMQEEFIERTRQAFDFQHAAFKLADALDAMMDCFCNGPLWIGVPIADKAANALEEFHELLNRLDK